MDRILLGVVALLIGAVSCFTGYKSRTVLLPAWSFLAGAVGGFCLCQPTKNVILSVILMLVMGTALTVLMLKIGGDNTAIYNGVLLATAGIAILAVIYSNASGNPAFIGRAMIVIGAGILAGLISLYFKRIMTIVSTAASGACVLLLAASIIYNRELVTSSTGALILVLFLPIAIAGFIVQNKTEEPKKSK